MIPHIPRTASLVVSLLACGISNVVEAQIDYVAEQRSTCVGSVARSTKFRPFSAGVINGKALYLAKPNYPIAARELRVSGQVQVSILIDPRGCVAEADAKSGHPMLRTSAIQAARESFFSPIVIGARSVWINGVIVYNFRPNERNWLELGFTYRDHLELIDYLPAGFSEERAILRQTEFAGWEQREKSLQDVRTRIETKLHADSKSAWLFALGIWLVEIKDAGWNDSIREGNFRGMQLGNVPDGVSSDLLNQLRTLSTSKEPEEIRGKINGIIERMFVLGR
jgi:TonB family protein